MKTDKRMLGMFVRAQVEFMYKAGRFATARDLFLFSLYACGISFVDLVYLRPENLRDGYLICTRRKTGRQIVVKLTSAMQGILARYAPESRGYLPRQRAI